jgi:hypothetical protein
VAARVARLESGRAAPQPSGRGGAAVASISSSAPGAVSSAPPGRGGGFKSIPALARFFSLRAHMRRPMTPDVGEWIVSSISRTFPIVALACRTSSSSSSVSATGSSLAASRWTPRSATDCTAAAAVDAASQSIAPSRAAKIGRFRGHLTRRARPCQCEGARPAGRDTHRSLQPPSPARHRALGAERAVPPPPFDSRPKS